MKLSIDIFGDIEIIRAVDFFNVGKYDISSELFAEAGKSMSNPRMAEIFTSLSNFYLNWNIFKFKEAFKISSTLLDQILRFSFQMSPKFKFDIKRLQKQRETINKLYAGNKDYILLNFYFTAERYERNSQHDIATLLYYRTIEGIFEKVLEDGTKKFDRSKPDYSLLGVETEELRQKYITIRKKVYEHTSQHESLPDKIAMFDAFCLIEALEKEFSKQFPINRVANIANIRNKSIYAHGIEPLTEKDVDTIRNFTRDVMTKYLSIQNIGSIETERDKFEFIKLEFKNH
jgi:CRISPR-associated protein (Cas_Cas02710)